MIPYVRPAGLSDASVRITANLNLAKENSSRLDAISARLAMAEEMLTAMSARISALEKAARQKSIRRKATAFDQIIAAAVELSGRTPEEIVGGSRNRSIVPIRFYVAQRAADELGWTRTKIAQHLGRTDHSTIANACSPASRQKVQEWLAGLGAE